MFDPDAMAEAMLEGVKVYVDSILFPLVKRLDDLEARPVADGMQIADEIKALRSGIDGTKSALESWTAGEGDRVRALAGEIKDATLEERVAALEARPTPLKGDPGEPGKDFDPAILPEIVAGAVAEAVKAIPAPQDGKDADMGAVAALITESVGMAVKAIELPEPKAVDPESIRSMVAEEVAKIPAPQDGKSIDPADVAKMVSDEVAKIPPPKNGADGISAAGALIDRDGELVLTLSNGQTCKLGTVVGRDGADVDMAQIEKRIADEVAKIPAPKDGMDGVGFDDLSLAYDGERTITLQFARGDVVKELACKMPVVLDRGVYRETKAYEAGDAVSFGGSIWIAQRETSAKPEASEDWRLAVKRGRDGKDASPAKKVSA